jgi:hypothetical protein
MIALEQERKFYEQHRKELLAEHAGLYALIKGEEMIGAFATLREAYEHGIGRFGNIPMLIRQILPADPAHGIPAFTQGLLHAGL